MAAPRVSTADLLFAADWLDTYDGDADDPNNAAARRTAEWIMAEVDRRTEEAAVRGIVRDLAADGVYVTKAKARAALREAAAAAARP